MILSKGLIGYFHDSVDNKEVLGGRSHLRIAAVAAISFIIDSTNDKETRSKLGGTSYEVGNYFTNASDRAGSGW
jgi:hypothetical protein